MNESADAAAAAAASAATAASSAAATATSVMKAQLNVIWQTVNQDAYYGLDLIRSVNTLLMRAGTSANVACTELERLNVFDTTSSPVQQLTLSSATTMHPARIAMLKPKIMNLVLNLSNSRILGFSAIRDNELATWNGTRYTDCAAFGNDIHTSFGNDTQIPLVLTFRSCANRLTGFYHREPCGMYSFRWNRQQ
ncbi:hypothetical protein HDU98_004076 [Podochytrium sp. JEL0797]|nr:hypothetical protein HDU98_004076 [Podochytrium sp. JEL0797]